MKTKPIEWDGDTAKVGDAIIGFNNADEEAGYWYASGIYMDGATKRCDTEAEGKAFIESQFQNFITEISL